MGQTGGRTPLGDRRGPRSARRAALPPVLLVALALALIAPAHAGAVRPFKTGLEGVRTLNRPDSWGIAHAVAARVRVVRINAPWAVIAPSKPRHPRRPGDPAYRWNSIDSLVKDVSARGMKVLLTVYAAPRWAQGRHRKKARLPGTWKPKPRALGAFGHALAARYSGKRRRPRVSYFEPWNEPNLAVYLEPTWRHKHGKIRPASPKRFVSMANRFYKGVKSVHRSNKVVAPSSSPYGDPRGGPYPFTAPRMHPLYFLRQITCLTRKHGKLRPKGRHCRSARFDIVSQHPIDRAKGHGPTYHAKNPDDVGPGDMGRIRRTIRAAERHHTVARHPKRRSIWVTEFWRASNPPDRTGVPPQKQARWIEQGLYEFWRSGVSVAIYQGLVDNGGAPPKVQSGLFFANLAPKPSWVAFRFPFVGDRLSRNKVRVWGKAPTTGILRIQRRINRSWRTVLQTRKPIHRNRIFRKAVKIRGKATLRARVGTASSLPWNQG